MIQIDWFGACVLVQGAECESEPWESDIEQQRRAVVKQCFLRWSDLPFRFEFYQVDRVDPVNRYDVRVQFDRGIVFVLTI